MTDIERIDERLTAVERAVVDGDFELEELAEVARVLERVDDLESRLDDIEDRLADVEARSQAVEGYVGNIDSVNEGVEQRADAAIAAVDRLEHRLEELEEAMDGGTAERTEQPRTGVGTRNRTNGDLGDADLEDTIDEIVPADDDERSKGEGSASASEDEYGESTRERSVSKGGRRSTAGSSRGRDSGADQAAIEERLGDGSSGKRRTNDDADAGEESEETLFDSLRSKLS